MNVTIRTVEAQHELRIAAAAQILELLDLLRQKAEEGIKSLESIAKQS